MLKKYWSVILYSIIAWGFMIIRPAFQAPDEVNHFYQIYHYSEFKIKPDLGQESLKHLSNRSGVILPKGFASIKSYVFKQGIEPTLNGFTFTDYAKDKSRSELTFDMKNLKINATPDNLINYYQQHDISPNFRETVNTTIYSPLAYLEFLPSAIIGQLLELPPYSYFKLLQISVFIFYLVNFYYLIKNNNRNKPLLYFLMLNPMLIFLSTSISVDSLLIISSLMLFGLVFTTNSFSSGLGRKLIFFYSIIISGLKFPYFLLLLPIILSNKISSKQRKEIIMSGILGITCWIIWLGMIHNYIQPYNLSRYGEIYPYGLDTKILSFISNFLKSLPEIITGIVGFFGWLEIPIPKILVFSYLLYPFLIKKTGENNHDQYLRIMTGMLLILIFLLISFQLFVFWYSNGLTSNGWQGRYLIPLLPTILVFIQESRKIKWQLLLLVLPVCYSLIELFKIYRIY